jgi:CheY-like chemotaxis protein
LLGGEIGLISAPTEGSTFTLYLPQSYSPSRSLRSGRSALLEAGPAPVVAERRPALQLVRPAARNEASEAVEEPVPVAINVADDDRDNILPGELVLLIVENELAFAKMLLQAGRKCGFKGLVSPSGAGSLALIRDYRPALITLDIHLPDMLGLRILDRLKADLAMRHIPICVVSTDDSRERALDSGAVAFIAKPLQSIDEVEVALRQLHASVLTTSKRLVVALQPSPVREKYIAAIRCSDLQPVVVETGEALRQELARGRIDCLVTDGALPDFNSDDLAEYLENSAPPRQLPILLYRTSSAAPKPPWDYFHHDATLRTADSLERLIDATAFLLHRGIASMTDQERAAVDVANDTSKVLTGKKVLIVDDDMRNIFALATVLEEQGMVVVSAENGRDAIQLVQQDPAIDAVLMDIMMPEMDGMQTMRELRKLQCARHLPLIAVTAKAMKGDREKCIEAGAWDYLSKPVDTGHLLVVLRGWLCK